MESNEERKRNLSKLRQRKFYEKNSAFLLDKRKKQRVAKKQPENIPQVEVARESKSLDYLNTKIDSVCDNDMTKLTHKQRMKIFFQLTEIDDIEQDLLDYDKIINCMETATYGKKIKKTYAVNSKKNMMESVLFSLDKCDISMAISIRTEYQDYYNKLKIISSDELQIKKTSQFDSVLHFEDYRNKILEKYGESKEFLLVKLYENCCCRDDYGMLKIVDTMQKTTLDKSKNYLVLNSVDCNICLQNYKTSKNKEPIYVSLLSDTRILLENYIKRNNITDVLFSSKNLSQFISKMNKRVDVNGGINYIRHSMVSSVLTIDVTPEVRLDLSKKLLHSPITSLDYIRMIEE